MQLKQTLLPHATDLAQEDGTEEACGDETFEFAIQEIFDAAL